MSKPEKTVFWLMLFIQIPFWLLCISGETEQLGSVAAKYGWHTQPAVIAAFFVFGRTCNLFSGHVKNVCFSGKKDGEWDYPAGICSVGAPRFLQYVHTEYFWKRRTERCLPWGTQYFNFCLQIFIRECHIRIMLRVFMDITDFSLMIPMELVHGDFSKPLLPWLGRNWSLCTYLCISLSWNC